MDIEERLKEQAKLKKKVIGYAILTVVLLIVFLSSVYTIETGTVGVLSTFGEYKEESITPGIHIKIPFVQNIQILDTKMQSANYKGSKDLEDGKGVVNKPRISVLDAKNLPIGIDMTIMYTPKSFDASSILGKYGVNYFEKLINPNIRDMVRDVIGKYVAEDIAKDRAKISGELKVKLIKRFEDLPFVLNEVSLRNIQLPKIVLKKVEEVQIAKQEEQKLAMVENQAKKKQKIQTIQANTLLIEITTKAKADAEKKKIEADAKAYQLRIEAQAIAEANTAISKSITKNLIQYNSIKRWNGAYPQTLMSGNDTGVLLNLPAN